TQPPVFGTGPAIPGRSGPSHNDGVLYIVSGIVFAAVGWAIGTRIFGDTPPSAQPVFGPSDGGGTLPPPQVTAGQAPTGGGGVGGPGGGGSSTGGPGGGGSSAGGPTGPLRAGFNLPPRGETQFVPDEVLAESPLASIEEIAQRHQMTCPETVRVRLTGRTLHRCLRLAN